MSNVVDDETYVLRAKIIVQFKLTYPEVGNTELYFIYN